MGKRSKNNFNPGELNEEHTTELQSINERLQQEIAERKRAQEELRREKERLFVTLSSIGDGVIAVDNRGLVTLLNPVAESLTGWGQAEALGRPLEEVFIIESEYSDQPVENPVSKVFSEGRIVGLANHTALISRDGAKRSIADSAAPIIDGRGNILGVVLVFRDVTGEREQEKALRSAKRQFSDIIEFLPDAICVIDRDKKVIAWNRAMEKLTGVSKEDMLGKGDYAYAVPFYGKPRPMLIDFMGLDDSELESKMLYPQVKKIGDALFTEIFTPSLFKGRGALLWAMASPLWDSNGRIAGAIESIRDITEQKQIQKQLQYLMVHDPLTGLYNRTFFEQQVERMAGKCHTPVGMMVCDVDGLKLVNDTLGNNAGDALLVAAAGVIKKALGKSDLAARIGGDEFAVLLPGSGIDAVEDVCRKIKNAVTRYNHEKPGLPMSLSIGFAVGGDPIGDLKLLYKEADSNMNREKLHHGQSSRSAVVQTLMKALEARDYITEGHADRLQDMVAGLAAAIGLPQRKITDLRLLARFHDIGKVGIPDRILFKQGTLTPEEYVEMQRHCEIGYRIAQSSPDLAPIADCILKHHEWYNGRGYPLGLKEGEIPLECRILSIADAFDAMTSDRPYRRAMTCAEALAELERCAGTQFDRYLVDKFISL